MGRCSKLEKIIVTAALIYANGEVHLGHITSTYLPADILVRYFRLRGDDVIYVHATDDFGTPILIAAEKAGKTPEEYVSYWNEVDQKDFGDLGISFDTFYKTSSRENRELTHHFFKKLNEKGYIFKRVVSQPYCNTCRKFLPDRYVIGTCPHCSASDQYSDGCEECGRTLEAGEILNPHCAICGSKPVAKQSEHYFFKLTQFSDALRRWLTENKNLQPEVKNYVLNWIKEGLRDWDITRDLTWGVRIPLKEAEGKVLYNWFDNHLCYISTALKYFADRGVDGKEAWNSSRIYHFIGKDIVYHHYLFLPAMRLGEAAFKLPDYIPTRGFVSIEGRSFSKSRGWYISLRAFLNQFPADYLRYYLAAITPYSQVDINFDWEDFQSRINNELIANIGNFIHRTLTFTWNNYDGKVPEPVEYDVLDREFERRIKAIASEVATEIEKIELSRGLKKIIEFSTFCNQYFQRKQPWTGKDRAKTCLYLCVNAVRSLAILLLPYAPFSAEKLWQQLGISSSIHEQTWDSASELAISNGHKINKPKVLFRKVAEEEIEEQKKELLKATQK